jgi:hypothetical protein
MLKPRELGTQHSNYPTRQLKCLILTSDAQLPCTALPKTAIRVLQNLHIVRRRIKQHVYLDDKCFL